MIQRYNNLSFLFFIPGIIAQVVGAILSKEHPLPETTGVIGIIVLVVGTVLAMTGFGFYAKAKGHSPFWGLAGFIGLPGLLLLATLKDRSGDRWNT